ncbi:MAG: NAD(P)-binding protein [Eubacterium sp.]|nr:NAD(P)-binding protein [Eubacterium sp.]
MDKGTNSYDYIVVGAGFAGAVAARELAEKGNKRILIIDSRDHVGGNCYDAPDEDGILIHKYGPHIFHTDIERVYTFLSRFTDWYDYSHEVVARVGDELIPVPFNLNTLDMVFKDRAPALERLLKDKFGEGARVPILKLRQADDPGLKEIADYVYNNIFLKYTLKQWGKKPEEIDEGVSGRVPVVVSRDNRYFRDKYQGMPAEGYTALFEKMLDHENITVKLSTEADSVIRLSDMGDGSVEQASGSAPDGQKDQRVIYARPDQTDEWERYFGRVIFTGAIDELFDCCYGRLPYRSLRFDFSHYDEEHFQSHGVVNYTVSEDFTRITEFKYLTGQTDTDGTTIVREYPFSYTGADGEIPYYAINNTENDEMYDKYKRLADKYGLILIGRLAEYRYYNIDAIVDRALDVVSKIL